MSEFTGDIPTRLSALRAETRASRARVITEWQAPAPAQAADVVITPGFRERVMERVNTAFGDRPVASLAVRDGQPVDISHVHIDSVITAAGAFVQQHGRPSQSGSEHHANGGSMPSVPNLTFANRVREGAGN